MGLFCKRERQGGEQVKCVRKHAFREFICEKKLASSLRFKKPIQTTRIPRSMDLNIV